MKYNFDKACDRSNTNCVKWDAVKEVFGREDVIPMWVADMDFPAAKPIVDLMPAVAAGHPDDLDRCVAPIVALGYEYIAAYEDELPYRRFFRLRGADRRHNVHLVEQGGEFWVRHLAFRDILRTHPQVAAQYAALKASLALRYDDVNDYAAAKTEFIESTLAAPGAV